MTTLVNRLPGTETVLSVVLMENTIIVELADNETVYFQKVIPGTRKTLRGRKKEPNA